VAVDRDSRKEPPTGFQKMDRVQLAVGIAHCVIEEKFMFEGLLQPMHLLVILIIAMFVFGPKKLPELGKGLGEGIRGFKKAMSDVDAEK
jgi:TatA/E family protein of Tat protein translocase